MTALLWAGLAAGVCALVVVVEWIRWELRLSGRRWSRRVTVQLARFRSADDAWGDEVLRQREYQAALTLAKKGVS